jgi:hypothetical protein
MESVPHQTRCEHVPHGERQIPSRLSAIQPANMGVRATVTSHIGGFSCCGSFLSQVFFKPMMRVRAETYLMSL